MDIADCRESRVGQANVSLSKMCSKLPQSRVWAPCLKIVSEGRIFKFWAVPGHLQGMGLVSFVASRIYKNLEPDLFSFE